MTAGFDTIILGGGAAGCVLANRLSARSSRRGDRDARHLYTNDPALDAVTGAAARDKTGRATRAIVAAGG